MIAHVIEDNIIVNTIEVDDLDILPNLISAENGGKIGDLVDGESFTPPQVDLAILQAEMWEKIKAERSLRMSGGFRVEVSAGVYKWYHSDPPSRLQQLGLLMAGDALPAIPWKTMDGTFETMTPTIVNQIFQAGFTLDTTLFTVAEQHKAAMEQSTDPLSYNYSTGWPEHYEL